MVISKMQSILRVSGTVSPGCSFTSQPCSCGAWGQGVHSQPTRMTGGISRRSRTSSRSLVRIGDQCRWSLRSARVGCGSAQEVAVSPLHFLQYKNLVWTEKKFLMGKNKIDTVTSGESILLLCVVMFSALDEIVFLDVMEILQVPSGERRPTPGASCQGCLSLRSTLPGLACLATLSRLPFLQPCCCANCPPNTTIYRVVLSESSLWVNFIEQKEIRSHTMQLHRRAMSGEVDCDKIPFQFLCYVMRQAGKLVLLVLSVNFLKFLNLKHTGIV